MKNDEARQKATDFITLMEHVDLTFLDALSTYLLVHLGLSEQNDCLRSQIGPDLRDISIRRRILCNQCGYGLILRYWPITDVQAALTRLVRIPHITEPNLKL